MGQDDAKCSLRAPILTLDAYYGIQARRHVSVNFHIFYEHLTQ